MKKTSSVIDGLHVPDKDSTLMNHYYRSISRKTPMPGWSIGGIISTDSSPQPTPPSSPTAKRHATCVDLEHATNQLLDLHLNTENDFGHLPLFPSMDSMPQSTFSASATLFSFNTREATPYTSAEELISGANDLKLEKSSPIQIKKKGNRKVRFKD
jgi:hypothetical protein